MTWNLGKKDSRCAIRVFNTTVHVITREQEVWVEYGIYIAHKHNYLFKIIHKRHLKEPKKEVQIPPESSPRDQLKLKNHSDAVGARKKPILGARVPHRARQKDPKLDLQTQPRAPKDDGLYLTPKSISLEPRLEAPEAPFGG